LREVVASSMITASRNIPTPHHSVQHGKLGRALHVAGVPAR
jgi:hypothetical protein